MHAILYVYCTYIVLRDNAYYNEYAAPAQNSLNHMCMHVIQLVIALTWEKGGTVIHRRRENGS